MYERYEKWGYPCLYTTKKNECTKGTKSGGTLVHILLKKNNVRKVRKMGVHTCLYTTKIDYEEWSSVSQTSMCCLSEASNFTKRSVRE